MEANVLLLLCLRESLCACGQDDTRIRTNMVCVGVRGRGVPYSEVHNATP